MEYQSDNINELAMALAKAQAEMEAASKSASNPFYKSKYADISSIIGASREALTKNGLSVVQSVVPHQSEGNSNGMALMTQLMHSSGQWMRSLMPMILSKTDHQAIGSCVSYYRRYAYSAMVGVITEDDDGEKGMDRNKKKEDVCISKEQAQKLREMVPQLKQEDFLKYLKSIGFDSVEAITTDKYDNIFQQVSKVKS